MTTTMTTTTLLLMMTMLTVVVSQKRSDVCVDVPNNNPNAARRPQIAQQFSVDVECNLDRLMRTVYVKEYYDLQRNRGRLTITKASGVKDYFMDYDQELILQVDPQIGKCTAGVLILQKDQFIFGFKLHGNTAGMFSPSAALRFNSSTENYVGQTVARGIKVDHWRSCQYIRVINATAKVDWYFSSKGAWNTTQQGGGGSVPVRMTAVGKMVLDNQTVISFNHVYDFFNYKPTVALQDFEVPDGVYCPGRNLVGTPTPFPKVPDSFYFTGELADNYDSRYVILGNYYDKTTNSTMFHFKRTTDETTGYDELSGLNDYNAGVSYTIDKKTDSCKWGPINKATMAYYVRINDKLVRMKTPQEFFYDSGTNYQYAGTVMVRNIKADRWVGVTDKLKQYQGQNVTVVWYYAPENLVSWIQDRMPVMLKMYLPNQDRTISKYEINIFGFGVNTMALSLVDTSPCFQDTQRVPLRFTLPKSQEHLVRDNVEQTKLAIQLAISLSTGISPNRVADIQLYFNEDNVEVSMKILGKPPACQDVTGSPKQNSICAALKLLKNTFDSGTFAIDFAQGDVTENVKPESGSLETTVANITCQSEDIPCGLSQSSAQNSLFGAGAFAGLAVGTFVAGGIAGSLGAFWFFK